MPPLLIPPPVGSIADAINKIEQLCDNSSRCTCKVNFYPEWKVFICKLKNGGGKTKNADATTNPQRFELTLTLDCGNCKSPLFSISRGLEISETGNDTPNHWIFDIPCIENKTNITFDRKVDLQALYPVTASEEPASNINSTNGIPQGQAYQVPTGVDKLQFSIDQHMCFIHVQNCELSHFAAVCGMKNAPTPSMIIQNPPQCTSPLSLAIQNALSTPPAIHYTIKDDVSLRDNRQTGPSKTPGNTPPGGPSETPAESLSIKCNSLRVLCDSLDQESNGMSRYVLQVAMTLFPHEHIELLRCIECKFQLHTQLEEVKRLSFEIRAELARLQTQKVEVPYNKLASIVDEYHDLQNCVSWRNIESTSTNHVNVVNTRARYVVIRAIENYLTRCLSVENAKHTEYQDRSYRQQLERIHAQSVKDTVTLDKDIYKKLLDQIGNIATSKCDKSHSIVSMERHPLVFHCKVAMCLRYILGSHNTSKNVAFTVPQLNTTNHGPKRSLVMRDLHARVYVDMKLNVIHPDVYSVVTEALESGKTQACNQAENLLEKNETRILFAALYGTGVTDLPVDDEYEALLNGSLYDGSNIFEEMLHSLKTSHPRGRK